MKKKINVLEYASEILTKLKKGALITTKADDIVDCMTISWGTLGIEWGKEIFTVFVRESRYTRSLLEKNKEFTINLPVGDFDKNIIDFAGANSRRTVDKVTELNLTLVDGECVNVPAIKELPLTLECKVVYSQLQDKNEIIEKNQVFYPQDVDGSFPRANQDYHICFCGEIVNAYIVE